MAQPIATKKWAGGQRLIYGQQSPWVWPLTQTTPQGQGPGAQGRGNPAGMSPGKPSHQESHLPPLQNK